MTSFRLCLYLVLHHLWLVHMKYALRFYDFVLRRSSCGVSVTLEPSETCAHVPGPPFTAAEAALVQLVGGPIQWPRGLGRATEGGLTAEGRVVSEAAREAEGRRRDPGHDGQGGGGRAAAAAPHPGPGLCGDGQRGGQAVVGLAEEEAQEEVDGDEGGRLRQRETSSGGAGDDPFEEAEPPDGLVNGLGVRDADGAAGHAPERGGRAAAGGG